MKFIRLTQNAESGNTITTKNEMKKDNAEINPEK